MEKNKLLEILYEKTRIINLSNTWESSEVENFRYVVELQLTPRSDKSALSDN